MSLETVPTLAGVEALILQTNAMDNEEDRIRVLCDHVYSAEDLTIPPADPFSAEYRSFVLGVWRTLTGRAEYCAGECELSPFLTDFDNVFRLPPYSYGSTDMLGEFLITYGFIIKTMGLKSGARVLEYGAGNAQILLHLARIGCDVTAIDLEPRYIAQIREQARRMGVGATGIVGTFDQDPEGGPYDAVLFFESFHHALDHAALIERLSRHLKDSGILVFAGEPIIPAGGYWRPTIPYPWGPRFDLLSLRSSKAYGWLELGFQEEYFTGMLERYGWTVTKYPCPLTSRADTWIARRHP
ncbi:MAG TPA: class I SAM-dependent methyltransferase [Bryobacteraceae bacterium]|nr:class I SAM-dependent methyltransferase [Bryobacteraceae bacterium]